ncbi:MAG TPA: hypothetical protein VMJ75_10770 [Candidatus Acidoferrales bacterium]|nr:hypothetical protein [Candidatus Acidoferrales bacterium]HXK04833.1 hypothetical protein [Verrucomicrobiae bacterium]
MAKTISMIGVDPAELPWLRLMIWLLRHPDPNVAELTREALLYLEATASSDSPPHDQALDHTG